MGKGDRRTRRGKIYRGTFGKRRPRVQSTKKKSAPGATSASTAAEAPATPAAES